MNLFRMEHYRRKLLVNMKKNNTNKLIVLGVVNPANNDKWHQRNQVYSTEGVCCSTTATMFKDPPRVLVRVN